MWMVSTSGKKHLSQKVNLNKVVGGRMGKLYLVKEFESVIENGYSSTGRISSGVNVKPGLVNVVVELEVSFELVE